MKLNVERSTGCLILIILWILTGIFLPPVGFIILLVGIYFLVKWFVNSKAEPGKDSHSGVKTSNSTQQKSRDYSKYSSSFKHFRTAMCWKCGSHLSSTAYQECKKCGWLLCNCGGCGCGYRNRSTTSRHYQEPKGSTSSKEAKLVMECPQCHQKNNIDPSKISPQIIIRCGSCKQPLNIKGYTHTERRTSSVDDHSMSYGFHNIKRGKRGGISSKTDWRTVYSPEERRIYGQIKAEERTKRNNPSKPTAPSTGNVDDWTEYEAACENYEYHQKKKYAESLGISEEDLDNGFIPDPEPDE